MELVYQNILTNMKFLSILIPTYNAIEYTKKCLETVNLTNTPYELIMIDDYSTDGVREYIKTLGCRYILNDINLGVSATWNRGIEACRGDYICVCNSDILFTKDWDLPLIKALNDETWIASPYFTDNQIPPDFPMSESRRPNHISILGSCFMLERKNLENIGKFPEELKLWYGDNWIAERVKKLGKNCVHIKESYIHHFVSKSANSTNVSEFGNIITKDKEAYINL